MIKYICIAPDKEELDVNDVKFGVKEAEVNE